MIRGFALLLLFQAAGELLSALLNLPLPESFGGPHLPGSGPGPLPHFGRGGGGGKRKPRNKRSKRRGR